MANRAAEPVLRLCPIDLEAWRLWHAIAVVEHVMLACSITARICLASAVYRLLYSEMVRCEMQRCIAKVLSGLGRS